jgi:hypothetical protein
MPKIGVFLCPIGFHLEATSKKLLLPSVHSLLIPPDVIRLTWNRYRKFDSNSMDAFKLLFKLYGNYLFTWCRSFLAAVRMLKHFSSSFNVFTYIPCLNENKEKEKIEIQKF